MNQINLILGDWLRGKSIYPPFRRFLNLLFSMSISSFLFEKLYFEYTWLDILDYKAIIDFMIKGEFFVPLSIFIIVVGLTEFLSIIIFNLINHFKSVKLTRKILEYEINKPQIDGRLIDFQNISEIVTPITISPKMIVGLYSEIRKEIKPEMFVQLEKELTKPKDNLYANFKLAFKALIAITIYFAMLPYFGIYLYLGVLFAILIFMYLLIVAYRFLDILPTMARKFYEIAENYLRTHNE